ncbi:MAG TPA: hypothetical protein VN426_01010 [Syntrophomonadaceae bacterium]|nr:hypothetical protein [Syntrophomonadaceae bacterium]
MTELRSVTIKIDAALFEQIKIIADKQGKTISGAMRDLIHRGLAERVYEENTDLITAVIKDQVERVFRSYAISLTRRNTECPEKALDYMEERISLIRAK